MAGELPSPAKRPGDWPRCPACGALRITRCPICRTAGTDCTEVDPDFVGMVDVDQDAKPMSCGCGSGGCSEGRAPSPAEEGAVGADGTESAEPGRMSAESPPRMLLCPTCDDPFVPEYARRCESCGHEFPDGYDPEPEPNADERLNARAIAAILGLVALLVATVVYFALVL